MKITNRTQTPYSFKFWSTDVRWVISIPPNGTIDLKDDDYNKIAELYDFKKLVKDFVLVVEKEVVANLVANLDTGEIANLDSQESKKYRVNKV
jgi:hypothetical protein